MQYRPPVSKKPLQAASIYRDLRELLWPRRKLFAVGFLLIFVNRAAALVLPGSTKFLIDDVIQKSRRDLLLPLALAVGAAALVQAVTAFILTQVLSVSAQRMIVDLRIKMHRHISRLPIRFYDANKAGSLVSRIMYDMEGLRNLVGTGLVDFIGGVVMGIIAFFVLLKTNTTLTLLSLVFVAVFGFVMQRSFRWMRPIFRERSKANAEVTGRLAESIGGVRVVKGFHAEDREAAVFEAGAWRLFHLVRRMLFAQSTVTASSTLMMGAVSVTVMIVGGRMMLDSDMSIGEFFMFTLYLGLMTAPVMQTVSIGTQMTEAFAGLDRMHEIFAEQPEDVDPKRVVPLGRIRGHIQFDDVGYEYDPGKPVLHGVTLNAVPGTVTALVGSSGSGKSTLISLAAAFANPVTGRIRVDGVDLSTVTLDSFRSQLGVVFQDNFLFDGSIKENIRFGRPDASDEDVLRAAAVARVDEFAFKFEKGLDTLVGERGVKLSGGQRQRVAIARAILADPRILILDEATSSLDTESEALIQEGLAALMAGRTTFVIAHRLSTIRSADQILVLEQGAIVERGTHSELLDRCGRYFELYTRQAGLEANRFVNPGEKEAEPEVSENGKPSDTTDADVTREVLGLSRSPQV